MSNVFQFTTATYFQIPESVIESGKWARLTPSAKDLYTLLLYYAQKNTVTTIMLTAKDMLLVGMGRNSLSDAIDSLQDDEKLIIAERGSRGYTFELRDPVTGEELERIEDITKVSPEIVAMYWLDHLGNRSHAEFAGGLSVRCIFHEEKKDRDRNLSVTFSDGGAFHCHRCGEKGGILDFEIAVAAKDEEKINRNQAYSRVRTAHLRNGRKLAKRRARELAEAQAMM